MTDSTPARRGKFRSPTYLADLLLAKAKATDKLTASLTYTFTDFLDPERLTEQADFLRLFTNKCSLDFGLVAVSLILSALAVSPDTEGRLADARALYQQLGDGKASANAFRNRVQQTPTLLLFLLKKRLRELRSYVKLPLLQGRLAQFKDLLIPDASIYKVATALVDFLPSKQAGKAALKLHAVYSLRADTLVEFDFTEGTRSENQVYQPKWVKDALYIWDLGYNHYGRIIDGKRAGAHILQRLKQNGNPIALAYYDDKGRHTLRGKRGGKRTLEDVCQCEEALQDTPTLDFDVELEDENARKETLRVVCVRHEGEDRYYLTTLSREHFTPYDIAEIYTLRWEVELFFRELKGGLRADEVRRLSNLESLRAVTYASLLASLLVRDIRELANEVLAQAPQIPPIEKPSEEIKEETKLPQAAFSPRTAGGEWAEVGKTRVCKNATEVVADVSDVDKSAQRGKSRRSKKVGKENGGTAV